MAGSGRGGGWLRRARGSVRLRVTLLAAGVFAVALIVGAVVLLRSLERVLVDDTRAAAQVALARQAETLRSDGIPASASVVERDGLATVQFGDGGRMFVIAVPEGVDPADFLTSASVDSSEVISQAMIAERLGLPSMPALSVAPCCRPCHRSTTCRRRSIARGRRCGWSCRRWSCSSVGCRGCSPAGRCDRCAT
jgi:hypothetical protein